MFPVVPLKGSIPQATFFSGVAATTFQVRPSLSATAHVFWRISYLLSLSWDGLLPFEFVGQLNVFHNVKYTAGEEQYVIFHYTKDDVLIFLFCHPSSHLDQAVRALLVSSLILSIASAINSQLAMHCTCYRFLRKLC